MLRLIHSLVLLTVLAGCAAAPRPVAEKLDPLTSATLTYSAVTLVMYRDDPTYAAHARNFVSLGPFEVNRSGRYQYYLWLGIWNTNQPASVEQRREGFESIVILPTASLCSWNLSAGRRMLSGPASPCIQSLWQQASTRTIAFPPTRSGCWRKLAICVC